jgi:hypothetical protein
MHPALLNAYSAMLPRLQAAENLRAAQIVAVGTGSMKKHDSQALLGQWNRQAGPAKRLKPGKPGTQEFAATMAGAGLGVVIAPPKSAGDPRSTNE